MNVDTDRMSRLALRVADADLERSFAEEQARTYLRPIRMALISAGTFAAGNDATSA